MAITWLVRAATATNAVGHSYQENVPAGSDTYTNSRFYTSFDLTAYADADTTLYGPTADGSLTRIDIVVTGDPPFDPQS